MPGPVEMAQQRVLACERVFRRYGLPMLVEDHSNHRDVFGRAAPLLVVILLLGLVGAVDADWALWQNVLAVMGAAALIALGWALANRLRGRPWSALPQDVGVPELAFFVLAPAVPLLIAGWQWGAALTVSAGNLLTLGVIWAVVRHGVHATLWWGVFGGLRDVAESLLRLIRFLPLLLIFSVALFFNTEVWQVFDRTPGVSDLVLGAFFALLILAILRIRLASETRQVLAAAEATAAGDADPEFAALPPLTPPQLSNVRVMVAASQLLQVLVVSAAVGVFFFALGTLTITEEVMQAWDVQGGTWVEPIRLAGQTDLRISQTLLRVSVALATFTGLYYAISVLTDGLYRDDFIDDMATKMRDVQQNRLAYVSALAELREARHPDRPV